MSSGIRALCSGTMAGRYTDGNLGASPPTESATPYSWSERRTWSRRLCRQAPYAISTAASVERLRYMGTRWAPTVTKLSCRPSRRDVSPPAAGARRMSSPHETGATTDLFLRAEELRPADQWPEALALFCAALQEGTPSLEQCLRMGEL